MIARQEEHVTDWVGCYDLGWKGLICDEAISHPAKFSRGLIFRIIEHILAEGLVKPGDVILDPFAGVALGSLPCLMSGLSWLGCELEPRFAALGQQNIDLWNAKFSAMPKWRGEARIINGDSRNLAQLVQGAGVVSSPPYIKTELDYGDRPNRAAKVADNPNFKGRTHWLNNDKTNTHYGQTPGQLGAMKAGDFGAALVSSPPYAAINPEKNGSGISIQKQWETYRASGGGQSLEAFTATQLKHSQGYGHTNGQLSDLKEGNHTDALVSSPPFAGNSGGRGEASRNGIDAALFDRHSGGMTGGMGEDERNLGNLPVRGFAEAVVSSPPFENNLNNMANGGTKAANGLNSDGSRRGGSIVTGDYGDTPGNIGNDQGETFWAAARAILLQCALVLPSGAPAVWVTKRFVKNGQIVDFTGQWIALCEACGFRLLHHHRAWLVKNQGVGQVGIDGEIDSCETKKASFFRRLHELRRPDLAINWEDVVCTIRL